jgi:hypothetical protein
MPVSIGRWLPGLRFPDWTSSNPVKDMRNMLAGMAHCIPTYQAKFRVAWFGTDSLQVFSSFRAFLFDQMVKPSRWNTRNRAKA